MIEEDPEFSDVGRDPRFLPGWWITPMFVVGVVVITVAIMAAGR